MILIFFFIPYYGGIGMLTTCNKQKAIFALAGFFGTIGLQAADNNLDQLLQTAERLSELIGPMHYLDIRPSAVLDGLTTEIGRLRSHVRSLEERNTTLSAELTTALAKQRAILGILGEPAALEPMRAITLVPSCSPAALIDDTPASFEEIPAPLESAQEVRYLPTRLESASASSSSSSLSSLNDDTPAKKHCCALCNKSFKNAGGLGRHYTGSEHLAKLARTKSSSKPKRVAVERVIRRESAKKQRSVRVREGISTETPPLLPGIDSAKEFRCNLCNKHFSDAARYTDHCELSPRHLARVAEIPELSSAEESQLRDCLTDALQGIEPTERTPHHQVAQDIDPDDQGQYLYCEPCEYSFRTPEGLRLHQEHDQRHKMMLAIFSNDEDSTPARVHKTKRPAPSRRSISHTNSSLNKTLSELFPCNLCSMNFESKKALGAHERSSARHKKLASVNKPTVRHSAERVPEIEPVQPVQDPVLAVTGLNTEIDETSAGSSSEPDFDDPQDLDFA